MTIVIAPAENGSTLASEMKGKSGTILAVTEELRKAGLDGVPDELKVPQEDRPVDALIETDIDVPLIDLSLIATDRTGLVRKLGEAARTWGICRLVNHGIPTDLMKDLEDHGLKFFGQPEEEKSKICTKDGCPGRSYYTGNNTKEKRHSLHWAESFVMWFDKWVHLDMKVIDQALTDWSTADEGFRDAMFKYLSGVKLAFEQLSQLAAESLGLDSEYFSRAFIDQGHVAIRWNYYPACPLPDDVLGAHSHTDPNFLTILQQDKVGGLQIEKDGRWYHVKPVEGTLILNIADTFHIWSNGIFKSILHRVLVNKDVPRMSIATIVYTRGDQSLSPPTELVDEDHPRLYRDITGEEYSKAVLAMRDASEDTKVFNGFSVLETLKI